MGKNGMTMTDGKDNLKRVHQTLIDNGYNPPAYEQFAKDMEDENNLRGVYSTLQKEGYTPPEFDVFKSDMGFASQQPAQQPSAGEASATEPKSPETVYRMAQPQGEVYDFRGEMPAVSAPNRSGGVTARREGEEPRERQKVSRETQQQPQVSSGQSVSDGQPLGPEKFGKMMEMQAQMQQRQSDFHQRLERMRKGNQPFGSRKGVEYNPATGKVEEVYYTKAGEAVSTPIEQRQRNAEIDEALRPPTVDEELQSAYDERDSIDAAIAKRTEELDAKSRKQYDDMGFWARMAQGLAATESPNKGMAPAGQEEKMNDPQLQMLWAAKRQNQERIGTLERERGHDGFVKTLGKTLFSLNNWDFGLGELMTAGTLLAYGDSKMSGAEDEAREAMMRNTLLAQEAEQRYGSNDTFWQRAGEITGSAIPFVVEFVGTGGGYSAITKGATKMATKAAAKMGANKFGTFVLKNTGRLAGDMASGLLMANTTGSAKTMADIMERHQGQVVMNENGDYSFDGGKSWSRAIYEGEMANTIEYFTEKLGSSVFDPVLGKVTPQVGRLLTKGAEKIGAGRLSTIFGNIRGSEWVGRTKNILGEGGIDSYLGEVMEEESGILLNAMLTGDNKFSDLWDKRTQADIWGGMMMSIGFMKTPSAVAGTVQTGIESVQYHRFKHNTDIADRVAESSIGGPWGAWRDLIDGTTNEKMADVIYGIIDEPQLDEKQKGDALNYIANLMKMRGYNLRTTADAKDQLADTDEDGVPVPVEEAAATANEDYTRGYEADEDERRNIVIDEAMGDGGSNPAAEGMRQRIEDDADLMVAEEREEMKKRQHGDGTFHPATLKELDGEGNEKQVFIVDGNVVMDAEGNVDMEQSDRVVIVYEPETGKRRMIDPAGGLGVSALGEVFSQEMFEAYLERRKQAYIQQQVDDAQGKVSVAVGETVTVPGTDAQGTVVAVSEDGEGLTVQLEDGTQVPVMRGDLQEIADAEAMAAYEERNGVDRLNGSVEVAAPEGAGTEQPTEQPAVEPTEQPEEQPTAEPMPMREDGEADFMSTTPQRGHQYIYGEAGLSREEAGQFVKANIEAAEKELGKLKGKAPKMGTSLTKYQQEKAAHQQQVEQAQAVLDYWNGVRAEQQRVVAAERAEQAERDRAAHDAAVQAEQERQAAELAKQQEQAARGANAVHPAIREKWDAAAKVEGAENEITLANGETLKGRYMLVESGAATPSHNATSGFARSEGFPVDENGQTVNDRDYERDQNAQLVTRQMADQYDSRAIQNVPVVSRDGVVLSGNGRTMAGELAAQNGTDGAYIEHLRKYPQQFGFTPEQVEGMQHPRVVFVPDVDMPYTTETFAKFNQQDMKSQSRTEQSVKMGKTVDDATFGRIVRSINAFDTLGDFYNDPKAAPTAIGELHKAGVINQMQVAEMMDGEKVSGQGRQMLENMLIGKAFESNPDAVRQLAEFPAMRQSVVSALAEIANNIHLGEDYSLESELAQAINLAYQARKSGGIGTGEKVSGFARQQSLFPFDEGETVADYTNATVLMLADCLNDGRVSQLKKVLAIYNDHAAQSAAGQYDIFSGGVKSKEEIINDVLNILNNGTETEQQTALDGAAERRKEAAGVGQDGVAVSSDAGSRVERNREDNIQPPLSSDAEVEELLARMSDIAEVMPNTTLTPETWMQTFGINNSLSTPIGNVKMGENQYNKLVEKQRTNEFGMVVRTLQSPDVILVEASESVDGAVERSTSYVFVKIFIKEDGTKVVRYESVTVSQDGMEVSISSHRLRENQLREKLKRDGLLYKATALDAPANTSAEQPTNGGSLSSETDAETEPQQPNNAVSSGSSLSAGETSGISSTEPIGEPTVSERKDTNNSETEQEKVVSAIKSAEAEVDTNPTEGQKKAGNYKMGHVTVDGYDITIENPKGSVRRGTDPSGKAWEQEMHNTYGYIRGTEGVDGDHIDVFLSDDPTTGGVYVVDQVDPQSGEFDEHKVMYGFGSRLQAEEAYLSNYEKGWKGLGEITYVSKEEFKKWIESSHRKTKPFVEYRGIISGAVFNRLADGYERGDKEAIQKAVNEIQKIIENEDLLPFDDSIDWEEAEYYEGDDPKILAYQYAVRAAHDRFLDDDEDQEYIKTGIKSPKAEPYQAPVKEENEDLIDYAQRVADGYKEFEKQVQQPAVKKRENKRKPTKAKPKDKQEEESPLMKQYKQMKEKYPDHLLLFRVGDFYESFSEDARTVSEVLGITLVRKPSRTTPDKELAGMPLYALNQYLPRLIKAGNKVVIIEELEAPKPTEVVEPMTEEMAPLSVNDMAAASDAAVREETATEQPTEEQQPESYAEDTAAPKSRWMDGNIRQQKGDDAAAGTQIPGEAEKALRDELIEVMRGEGGMEVITDEEGQRVLDEYRELVRLMNVDKRKTTSDTRKLNSPEGEKAYVTVISDAESGAKVRKKLDTLAKKYEEKSSRLRNLLNDIAEAVGAKQRGSGSKYVTMEARNGKIVTIRLSNHNASVRNFDNNGEPEGVSIVVAGTPNNGVENNGNAHVVEFFYRAQDLRSADGKPLVNIIRSVEQMLYSGEYKDTTGLASVQEVNAETLREMEGQPMFFRTEEGEVYGFTKDGKIYIDPKVATSETPIHEYSHLWAQALRKANPQAWKRLKEEMKAVEGGRLWEYVKSKYPELEQEDELMEEVFAHYSGRRGAERLRTEMRKEMGKEPDLTLKAQVALVFHKLREVLQKFWTMVRNLFAGKVEGLEGMTAEDFADMALGDLLKGFDPRGAARERTATGQSAKEARDREYMAAVERRDMETAQQMVNEAAREAMPDTKIVDKNGTPRVVYHQTANVFTVFNPRHHGAGTNDNQMPFGVYLKPTDSNIGVQGERQMALFADIKNPLHFADRTALSSWLVDNAPGYREAKAEYERIDREYENRFEALYSADGEKYDELWERWRNGEISEEEYQRAIDEVDSTQPLLDEWYEAENRQSAVMKNLVDDYMRGSKYDGIVIDNDEGSFGRTTSTILALNPAQVKSADAVTYDAEGRVIPLSQRFDKRNADIRYEKAEKQDIESVNQRIKQAKGYAERLNLGDRVQVVATADEITDEKLTEKQKSDKALYSPTSDKIYIILGNHRDLDDVMKSLLHEGVAHHGLRELFGDHFDTFLDNVYAGSEESIRVKIASMAAKHGWNVRTATEEYLAQMAETMDFEKPENISWWSKVKTWFFDMLHKIGFTVKNWPGTITDNELAYVLWRSYQNMVNPGRYRSPIEIAEDTVMQDKLSVGQFEKNADRSGSSNSEVLRVAEGNGLLSRDGEDVPKVLARDAYERAMGRAFVQTGEAMQDSMMGLKQAYKAILEAEGNKGVHIEDAKGYENAYLAENRMSSMNASHTFVWVQEYIDPLTEEIGKIAGKGLRFSKAKYSELTDYMMAKHGLERNEVMARRDADAAAAQGKDWDEEYNNNRNRDYAGLTALTGEQEVSAAEDAARQMVTDYEAGHDTAELWEAVNRATKSSLQTIADAGYLTPDKYKEIRDMYEYYIPLQGFDEETADEAYDYLNRYGAGAAGSPIKRAEGRKSKADDPVATILANGEAAIRMANRNLMKQHFLRFVEAHPSDLVSVSDVWLRKNDVTGEWEQYFDADLQESDSAEVVAQKVDAFEQKMEQLSASDPDHYKRGRDLPNVPYRVVNARDMSQHQVRVMKGGQTVVLTINGNPRAAQALNGLTNPDINTDNAYGKILDVMQDAVRRLSVLYTSANPDFVVSNFFRDAIYANTIVWIKETPSYAWKFNRNFGLVKPATMAKLFYGWQRGSLQDKVKNGTASEEEKMFQDFMWYGGETGWTAYHDIEEEKKILAKAIQKNGTTSEKVWKALHGTLGLANRSVENCARFAAFQTSRQLGRSVERAIWDAKEVSVNFNKKGASDRFMTAKNQKFPAQVIAGISGLGRGGYAFWNAGIQGLFGNFVKNIVRHPVKGAALMGLLYGLGRLMPWVVEAVAGGGGDDDDDKNAYYNLPEYKRRSNICFRFTNDMPWITIPIPIEYRTFYGLGELHTAMERGIERKTVEELTREHFAMFSQLLPLDFMEGGGGWHAMYPTPLKPYIEASTNESWTGLPIYRENKYGQYDEGGKPQWQRAFANADRNLVFMTRWLNEATVSEDDAKLAGGNIENLQGWIDWNPAKIEYMLKGYLGGPFTFLNNTVKTFETVAGKRDYEWRNMPLLNRLVYEGDERTEARAISNEYFRLLDEYNATSHKLKEYAGSEESKREDPLALAERVAFLNNSKEYLHYLVIHSYKPLIDEYYKLKKESEGDMMRKELVDLIHSIDDERMESVDAIDAAIEKNLTGVLDAVLSSGDENAREISKAVQKGLKKHNKLVQERGIKE